MNAAYLVLPVRVGEGQLEIVVGEVDEVRAATFAHLLHLADDHVGAVIEDVKINLLASFAWKASAVESKLTARGYDFIYQGVFLI